MTNTNACKATCEAITAALFSPWGTARAAIINDAMNEAKDAKAMDDAKDLRETRAAIDSASWTGATVRDAVNSGALPSLEAIKVNASGEPVRKLDPARDLFTVGHMRVAEWARRFPLQAAIVFPAVARRIENDAEAAGRIDKFTGKPAPEATRGVSIEHANGGDSVLEARRDIYFASGNQVRLYKITRTEAGGSWVRVWHVDGMELLEPGSINHARVTGSRVSLPGVGGPVLEEKRKIVFKSGHQCNLRGVYHLDVTSKTHWIIGHSEGHEVVTVANVDHVRIN